MEQGSQKQWQYFSLFYINLTSKAVLSLPLKSLLLRLNHINHGKQSISFQVKAPIPSYHSYLYLYIYAQKSDQDMMIVLAN